MAYRIVPLSSGDRSDGFTVGERGRRLHRLLAVYASDAEPREVITVLHERLLALADFSEDMADRLAKPEVREHARLYRHDAAHLPAV